MNPIEIAFTQYGIREISGKRDNPEVLKYFNEIGFDGSKLKDETAWCAAFVNWCLLKSGISGTGKLNARSFLDIGNETKNPKLGDITVLWRESPNTWKGHVGFFIRETKDWIYMLGGNQNNQVNIRAYRKNRVLKYICI